MSSTTAALQVTEFVQTLALSWKTLAQYPSGHPALVRALDNVGKRLAELRGPAGDVTLGISSDGLLYGDLKIESMAARKFAQALFTRGVAVLRFASETTIQDIETFLRLLAAGTPSKQSVIWEDLTGAGVININLQPVSYSEVRLTSTLEQPLPEQRETSLWDAVLRALLEGRHFSSDSVAQAPVKSADELTRMINELVSASKPEFDPDATFGIKLAASNENAFHDLIAETVGHYIADAWGMKKQNSLQQAIQLIQSLAQPLRGLILRAVLDALNSDEQAAALMRDLASELPADEVLDALRYLSSLEKLSSHSLSLLEVLTRTEEAKRAMRPAPAAIADLIRVFGDEDISRFNPNDHAALLASVAVRIPQVPPEKLSAIEKLGNRADTMEQPFIVRQFASTLLSLLVDIGSTHAPKPILNRIETIFRTFIAAGDLDAALEMAQMMRKIGAEHPNGVLRIAVQDTMSRFITADSIHDLIEKIQSLPPEKASSVQKLSDLLGGSMRRNLLVALAEENNRSRRRRLFDFVASLGKGIVPDVIPFLSDSRWYVVRNMLVLLRMFEDRKSLPEVMKLTHHADLRVKMEAIKTLATLGGEVPASVLDEVINDPDPKLADMAITLVGSCGISQGVGPLLRVLEGKDVLGARRGLRVKAIRALGELHAPEALPQLHPFFTQSILPWPSRDERLAAWESLRNYPGEARKDLVEKGLRSRDPHVRAICAKLSGN